MDISSGPILRHHPLFGSLYVPHLRKRVVEVGVGYLVRTNGDGFRAEHEFTSVRKPGVRRVLMFGDSQTAGDGSSNGKRFSDLIEKKLDRVEVYNLALTGSGTDQQYLIHREYAPKVQHDLTVICLFVENVVRIQQRAFRRPDTEGRVQYYGKPYFEIENDALVLHGVPTPERPWTEETVPESLRDDQSEQKRIVKPTWIELQLRRILPLKTLQWFVPMVRRFLIRHPALESYESPHSPGWRLMRAILEAWIRESTTPVLVVPLPLAYFLTQPADARACRARFTELAATTGCHLYDPLPDLLKVPLPERSEFWNHRTRHLSEAGHRFLADKLAAEIERLLPPSSAALT